MSEEKKNEVLEQNELNESELNGVAGGMANANNATGVNDRVFNIRKDSGSSDGVSKKDTFTVL